MTRRHLLAAAALALLATIPLPARQATTLQPADISALRLRNIGPATMSGRVVDMDVVESDPFTMYVASATGGVFRTYDNGVTWEPVFEREPVHSVGDIAIFQPNPAIIWVGTGERANRQSVGWGDGVYKTIDAGKTWTNVGLKTSKHIGRIVLHPTNPDIAYVAAQGSVWGPGGDRGLYRTLDGGRTWVRTLHVDEETGVTDVAMDWRDPSILYAASYQRRRSAFGFNGGGPGSALWKSTDGGATWTRLTGNGLPDGEYGRIGIAVYRKDPSIVYVSIEQGSRYNASTAYINRKAGLYRSNDRGRTWRFMSDWNPRPMYASQPTIDPNDDRRIYMLNSYSYSDDGGETFTSPRTTTHGDDRFVWVNPRDSRHVVKLDDGGIGISYDRGLKFLYVASLPLSQYYRVAVDNAHPYNVYGGLQDNGCWVGPSAVWTAAGILNEHWSRLCGGDGFYGVPDPKDPRVAYSSSQFLGLQRNDTRNWQVQDIRPGDPTGAIGDRRNWNTWGKQVAEQVLGNAMHPANWDAPIVDLAARLRHHLRGRQASLPLARPRAHLAGPRRHDERRRPGDAPLDGPDAGRDRPVDRRRRALLPRRHGDRRVTAAARRPVRGDRRREVPRLDGRRQDVRERGDAVSRVAANLLVRRHRALASCRRHRLRRGGQPPQQRLHELRFQVHRLRQDVRVDRRRPAGRARSPHDTRGSPESGRALSGHRDRIVRHGRRWPALDRAQEQHADAPLQRPRHPGPRERSGAGVARSRDLDSRSVERAPGPGHGRDHGRAALPHRAGRADPL